MGEITSRKRLSEYKPSPFADPGREAGAPEVTKTVFTEIRELFQRIRRKKPDQAA
jgi:hypothetical protein